MNRSKKRMVMLESIAVNTWILQILRQTENTIWSIYPHSCKVSFVTVMQNTRRHIHTQNCSLEKKGKHLPLPSSCLIEKKERRWSKKVTKFVTYRYNLDCRCNWSFSSRDLLYRIAIVLLWECVRWRIVVIFHYNN